MFRHRGSRSCFRIPSADEFPGIRLEPPEPGGRFSGMQNVIPLEFYRQRKRRRLIAAACREAVARSGMLVIQDASGRIFNLTGQFRFLEEGFENCSAGWALRMPYDAIKRVKVPSCDHGRPQSG